jgi:hypothetical protein
MPQTTYNLTPNPAQPGMLLSNDRHSLMVRTVPAGVVIPFGVLCETYAASNGQLLARPVQDSGAWNSAGTVTTTPPTSPLLVGISMLDILAVEMAYIPYAVPPSTSFSGATGYPVGFSVPFVFRGGVWGAWDGNTATALPANGFINVWHSSTGANPQGVFTTRAVASTAGAEIDSTYPFISIFDPFLKSGAYTDSFGNTIDVVSLQINLPGVL